MSDEKWEYVTTVYDPIQAEILKGLLEAQGVTVNIVREGYQAAFGLANQPGTKIQILAPTSQVEEAREVIEEYNEGKFEDSE